MTSERPTDRRATARGDASAKAGAPSEPALVAPIPTEPVPTEPVLTGPVMVEPVVVEPVVVKPVLVEPVAVAPAPVAAAVVEPATERGGNESGVVETSGAGGPAASTAAGDEGRPAAGVAFRALDDDPQCPACGSFELAGSGLRCEQCGASWRWQPGQPWPDVVLRPDHASR